MGLGFRDCMGTDPCLLLTIRKLSARGYCVNELLLLLILHSMIGSMKGGHTGNPEVLA